MTTLEMLLRLPSRHAESRIDMPMRDAVALLESGESWPELEADIKDWYLSEQERIRARKSQRLTSAIATRIPYGPVVYLVVKMPKQGNEPHVQYERYYAAPGILEMMCEHLEVPLTRPPLLRLVNQLPWDDETRRQMPIPTRILSKLSEEGYMVVHERLAIDVSNPWIRNWLFSTFPDAPDLSGYARRLGAPVLHCVHLQSIRVGLCKTFVPFPTPELVEHLKGVPEEKLLELKIDVERAHSGTLSDEELSLASHHFRKTIPQQADGSGHYHPDAECMKGAVEKYGAVAMQFTLTSPDGTFAKGIIYPREDCLDAEGNPSVLIDHGQVKGAQKPRHKEALATDSEVMVQDVLLGILAKWDKPGSMRGGFELLENIQCIPETKQIVRQLIDQAFADKLGDGISGLLSHVREASPEVDGVFRFRECLEKEGIEIDPLSIDIVRNALDKAVRLFLYTASQGAAIREKRYVLVLDVAVAPGTVVCRERVDTELALWRFPIVVSQGLKTVKVAPPSPHHLVAGKIPRHIMFMHPQDLTFGMQGDDDGDIAAASGDPRILELFKYRLPHLPVVIETQGMKINLKSTSIEGGEYIARNPMGPVGLFTILRSKLLAHGDIDGALAVSVLIQCAVDSAKKVMPWVNLFRLTNQSQWHERGGFYYPLDNKANKLPQTQFESWDHYIKSHVFSWLNTRARKLGVDSWWDLPGLDWRYLTDENQPLGGWPYCITSDSGFQGNLVDYANDYAHDLWDQVQIDNHERTPTQVQDLLPALLEAQGRLEWAPLGREEYLATLRAPFETFGRNMSKAKGQPSEELSEQQIAFAGQELQRALDEVWASQGMNGFLDIWYWEALEGRPNNCFRLFYENSPLWAELGMEDNRCHFLTHAKTQLVISKVMKDPNPHKAFQAKVFGPSPAHLEARNEHLWECSQCLRMLTSTFVSAMRGERGAWPHSQYVSALVSTLNKTKGS